MAGPSLPGGPEAPGSGLSPGRALATLGGLPPHFLPESWLGKGSLGFREAKA